MNDIQFEILRTLYDIRIEQGKEASFSIKKTIDRNNLGISAINKEKDEILADFKILIVGGYIMGKNFEILNYQNAQITDLGISVYKKEKERRNLKDDRDTELYEAQIANIKSTIETNKSIEKTNEVVRKNTQDQAKLSRQTIWFIGISAAISIIGVVINFLQYNNTSKVSIEQLDSLNKTIQKLEFTKIVYVKDSTQLNQPSKK